MITEKTSIGECVEKHPETIKVFMDHGMHCMGCAVAHFENIGDGAKAHGIDVKKLVEDLNKAVEKKK
jgi:hybrid cluster-associated redox disulfide protein